MFDEGENTRKNEEKGKTTHAVYYRVSDTGIGIRESQLSQLFSRFSQLDMSSTRQYHGSGLGLAISKELVRKSE
jgi:signal transduction histidine kinase